MPMMYGFGGQRRQMLEAELQRFVDEMPQLGMETMYLAGPYARGEIRPDTVLDLVVVQETDTPAHRRADFWTTHLRPRLGVNFFVYTRDEFENPPANDPLLQDAFNIGERVYG
jgi:predicted nucleotidyltransferase